jgi:hypothetical protein
MIKEVFYITSKFCESFFQMNIFEGFFGRKIWVFFLKNN